MSELLPCPFCGGEQTMRRHNEHVLLTASNHKRGCIMRELLPFVAFSIGAEAIAAWNTRAGGYCAFAQPTDLTDGCALLEKRTCCFVDDSDGEFPPKCSSCGYEPSVYECAWLADDGYVYEGNYCPNCGARVIA